MKLSEYFENTPGRGILATADSDGKVNGAVYARPHFIDDDTIAYIMADRLTHKNLQSNPHAAYIFMESKEGYDGKRLYLTKIKEDSNPELIESMRRKKAYMPGKGLRFLVYFRIDKVLPLIGEKEKDGEGKTA
jgi:hypothetical protein